ncbi:MAG: SxtJ family membrane protein [Burkholderiales bacterium]|nr:SxtJ family membrane protein [Burkholderiales bacterium]
MSTSTTLESHQLRSFGLLTGAIVAVLFGLLLPWLFSHAWPLWPWVLAALLAGLGLLLPRALAPVYRGWMKFGHVMGIINSRILLGLVFYGLLTPMGALMRALGWDAMRRRRHAASYRVPSRNRDKHHFERPY